MYGTFCQTRSWMNQPAAILVRQVNQFQAATEMQLEIEKSTTPAPTLSYPLIRLADPKHVL